MLKTESLENLCITNKIIKFIIFNELRVAFIVSLFIADLT